MTWKGLGAAALAVAALAFGGTAEAVQWPNGAKAAVVLTYDDALPSHLEHAIPALNAAGLKGTFFLSNVRQQDVAGWRAAAAAGHELANHTMFHACPAAAYPQDPRYTNEAYTPPSLLKEIAQQNAFLTALDGKTRHGFGSPCGATQAGGVDYIEPLKAAGLVSYIRNGVGTAQTLRADYRIDPMGVPVFAYPDTVTGRELIATAEQAKAGGGLAVLLFHGVAGDYLQVSGPAHRELIAWLAANRRDVWVTTLQEALDWAKAHP